MLTKLSVAFLLSICSQSALAAFGITDNGDSFTIDAGSSNPLTITVDSSNCDITSFYYRSQEYQYSGKGSHISSGLGSATVTAETVSDTYAKVTCVTDTLTHYYVVKSGESNVYMATYTSAEPDIGELRYIARLDDSLLPSEYPFGDVSTTADSTETVEGSDVFIVDGETRSKFYSSQRFIDDEVHCVYGDDVHACMLMPQYETSSGGPFFRDINTNNAGDSTNLYWYMNSGHVPTEDFRQGLHGPYVLTWSRSGVPTLSSLDFSFFADLDIEGYVADSGRGTVTGTASGVSSDDYEIVVHWHNTDAQYWTYASSSGAFTSPTMKPGEYTMILYQTELEVATSTVTVTAGSATTANIASTWTANADPLFLIGAWDGQPTGFLNAANQLRMHPSDSRMSAWGPVTYTVGSSSAAAVPMALWKGVNDPLTISLTLDADAQSGAATLRVGTTLAFAGARPSVTVNDYAPDAPAAPTKIDSRGVTRGAYRGYGEVYDFEIPDGTLAADNTITISVTSGSSGDEYLAPNFILDAIELFR
ncbi:Galactose-binding domain-like protein [Neofusicoccum parvum]|uniref:Galactose-binding domain-like protein n=1 Tax=Neofusicoccum parvum TaxID=310453 RepID=A0ACB5SMY4_9PEZI|nr:Galactose-binding domain-like protein [Neofusicoccum parvum]